jgi:hypothetical protein
MRRNEILAKPRWQSMAMLPQLLGLPLDQLSALDSLIDFMSEQGITQLTSADARVWARLTLGRDGLAQAQKAVLALEGAEAPEIHALRSAAEDLRKCRDYAAITRKPRRKYKRRISVPYSELPERWRDQLACVDGQRQDRTIARVDSLFDRMVQKLCQYAWFMRESDLEVELTVEGLRAFYQFETTRISTHGTPLRPATVLATFSDLRDYMRYSGDYPSDLLDQMNTVVQKLEDGADGVIAKKYAALANLEVKKIIPRAMSVLEGLTKYNNPAQRLIQRNRAMALALPPMTPLRREWHDLHFGRDLVWFDGRYRFKDYKLQKTRNIPGREIYEGSVEPSVQHFVDAVLLQDDDPRFLEAFRARAEKDGRPLFLHPNGSEVATNYVSQVWSVEFGTGAHINRTILYEIMFALGLDATHGAMLINDHNSGPSTKKYIGKQARAFAFAVACEARDEMFSDLSDDDDEDPSGDPSNQAFDWE